MDHFTITFKPDGKQLTIHSGATLIEAAGQAGIILNTVCGERGTCRKCRVLLEPDSREVLACQYRIENDLTVIVPISSRFFAQRILSEGLDPRHGFRSDIYEEHASIDPTGVIFGLAIDIGTTTVVVRLIDMKDGTCRDTEGALNPQTQYGDDVVSRIAYAETDEKYDALHKAIVDSINRLIEKLCSKTSIDRNRIYEVCAVGNTTMNHILLKLPIAQLGQAPYQAHSLDACDLTGGDLCFHMNPAGRIHTVENIAGFLGADTTAVALAADIDSAEEMTLIVDIGTNGEIVLGTKDKLYAASCAAGPALEGARITCGSRAAEGAIEAVIINGDDIDLDVIGDCQPHSICGSGLIDAVAVMLELGVVDRTGRFAEPEKLRGNLPPAIISRIVEREGQLSFILAETVEASARPVFLNQQDIRQMQLAKGAIRAGIQLLQRRIGLDDADIKRVLLAGAFGNYIRPESALRIGLLPTVSIERIHSIGNAAASGAQMILLNRRYREQAGELARKIEYVEIAHEPDFQMVFAESMSFDL